MALTQNALISLVKRETHGISLRSLGELTSCRDEIGVATVSSLLFMEPHTRRKLLHHHAHQRQDRQAGFHTHGTDTDLVQLFAAGEPRCGSVQLEPRGISNQSGGPHGAHQQARRLAVRHHARQEDRADQHQFPDEDLPPLILRWARAIGNAWAAPPHHLQ